MSMLERNRTSVFATVQGGGSNIPWTRINDKIRYPKRSYADGLNNFPSHTNQFYKKLRIFQQSFLLIHSFPQQPS